MSNATNPSPSHDPSSATSNGVPPTGKPRPDGAHDSSLMPPSKTVAGRALGNELHSESLKPPSANEGVGIALTDTPVSTAPSSPQINASNQASTPGSGRLRATTLDIPGLTKSKVSPDGRIAQRDLGSKLVVVMVGLPARGKSYVTKKLARYLNWLQHDTEIFNVGERRRVAAGKSPTPAKPRDHRKSSVHKDLIDSVRRLSVSVNSKNRAPSRRQTSPPEIDPQRASIPFAQAKILVNGKEAEVEEEAVSAEPSNVLPPTGGAAPERMESPEGMDGPPEPIEQSAEFFDPNNQDAVRVRELVALDTLDELLDYVMDQGGSVGILDATNSTMERRKAIVDHIRERAGPQLNILFLESSCVDPELLEGNMRLKLSGPDYRDKDPVKALEDFKKRVQLYEKSYVPLGEYEERHNMAYIQMIDVGRKVVSHQTHGFLSSQIVYYLLNFNLSPRQLWITRHGESNDNQAGRIGGDSEMSENGHRYGKALSRFIDSKRKEWESHQRQKEAMQQFPPRPGDSTPPNPSYIPRDQPRNFCVWSSMLKRSIQTVDYFNEEDYDVKQMKMLDELYAGKMEDMTYEEIREKYPEEYAARKKNKLFYRYPGPGGEGYLDVINRLRAVIIEVERTTDHVLLVTHRSCSRVLLAYFLGLKRDEVADLDVPLGMLYMLEPKPYGVEFRAYRYNPDKDWFDYIPGFKLRQSSAY
ncbi:bifunctional 6-phosphofructo-2-kinase/fructose-2,6-bisphosphate 2-phosphatase [Aspergillus campestris IBT 28561]|uniref:Bifunctional 6-phosphofructo-2-kinase/fructose-2,6-bisphosphate 2-phosphatase n=1 Tax=Aspergillus campestris (strain IBT 28561) TaxID=1392248 RepID=A0A2I1CXT9_ASPC2|nr:bifunctional 6-phosphofructo-2-kinase/fructose-2,6-bisphosphate 2-phosphatase [Aspergillus campestris IBT 28561]PKY02445.1 bifunctional 6-phosphofructo-2-kinase/fructose-2,6-bisphosphate 2-phosphatase [Aspergillus campestris IBT 28561]